MILLLTHLHCVCCPNWIHDFYLLANTLKEECICLLFFSFCGTRRRLIRRARAKTLPRFSGFRRCVSARDSLSKVERTDPVLSRHQKKTLEMRKTAEFYKESSLLREQTKDLVPCHPEYETHLSCIHRQTNWIVTSIFADQIYIILRKWDLFA